jgi:ATP-dependent Clp protease adaptor protein ClpS
MSTRKKEKVVVEVDVLEAEENTIILWNDDHNTFELVIETLIEVCGHEPIQAEQCTYLIHYTGKCGVKKGSFDELKPVQQALLDRGLTATIE